MKPNRLFLRNFYCGINYETAVKQHINMNQNILSIARLTAAIIVILFHQKGRFDYLQNLPNAFVSGSQMCTFYFVLSGFVLSLSHAYRPNICTKDFVLKRLKKNYPIYLISVLITLSFFWPDGNFNILNISINLALIQSWFPPYPLTINGPAWFLSTLLFCYLTFPFLVNNISGKKNINTYFIISLIIWVMTQVSLTFLLNSTFYKGFPSPSHDIIFYFPLAHYCSFLIGVAGGYKFKMASRNRLKTYQINILILVVLSLIIFALNNQDYILVHFAIKLPFESSLYAPAFLILIFLLFSIKDIKLKDELSKKVATLGALSFPIYILQYPVSLYLYSLAKKLNISIIWQLPFYLILLFITSIIIMWIVNYFFRHICRI